MESSHSPISNTHEASDPSVDFLEETELKRLKLHEKEDHISALPDSIIHHILSFLPSTKQAIQTGILSKRWRNQWSRVPVLIFNFQDYEKDYARFVDNTLLLYDNSKMKKFHIAYNFEGDTNFTSKILFATRRNVEVLILDFFIRGGPEDAYMLPKFIFDNASLVELQILNCEFQLSPRINLPSLKVLKMDCYCLKDSGSIENVISGSISLESLELTYLSSKNPIVIASKSLKILIFANTTIMHDLKISCPNLEKLCVDLEESNGVLNIIPGKTLQNVLSQSQFLYSLELISCEFDQLVISSKSLKKLVLEVDQDYAIQISCPKLEELDWCGSYIEHCNSLNLPSSCYATLDFVTPMEGCDKKLARTVLAELQRVEELQVQNWFVEVLSALQTRTLSSNPLLNVKCLTLDRLNFRHTMGIVNALRCSPVLESLIIILDVREFQFQTTSDLGRNLFEENYWISKGIVFTCLVSHLKIVEISGLSKKDSKCKAILRFVEFLLKTARVLEKMTVILEDGGTDFLVEVSRKLLSYPRYSRHAIVELL